MATGATVDPQAAKKAIIDYCLRKGALVAGVADLAAGSGWRRQAIGRPT
jgi:hypothetical protein